MPFLDGDRKRQNSKRYRLQRSQTHRRIECTFTREEAAILDRYAKREGVSTARLVARLALSQVDDRLYVPRVLSDALDRLSRLIGSMSTNVNQVAHAANRDAQMNRDIDARSLFESLHRGHQDMTGFIRKEFEGLWRMFQKK